MAVQASLTGHLVFSTLHTNDAPTAITRLLELGAPAYLINATLLGVLAQRLVRMLCPHCKQPGELDGEAWRRLTQPWNIAKPTSAFFPKGCLECRNTGYYGRIGIYEMLTVTPALRKQIRPESDVATLRAQCLKDGMQPLRLSGARKVGAGTDDHRGNIEGRTATGRILNAPKTTACGLIYSLRRISRTTCRAGYTPASSPWCR